MFELAFPGAYGILNGGKVAFDFDVIGAKLLGAAMRGLSFDSSSGASCMAPIAARDDGRDGSGTSLGLLVPVSGIGFTLTTAVTIAGAGKLGFFELFVSLRIT